ncbi:hypothetical protein PV735_23185 [Streptomyces turgidiscabies]|uniref:Uncharacterized protein n=1 Tax=Streptomyces turgidiscabies (strain Car8) TaxID=698760 RepID=L7FES5_STRT8|nr:hypothetical protein [Streptomyces turgidiscabies]ELP69165.1 hypothetical protein STRTUCAR8_07487 [Streptomyces turgidiscabies Car8]MDX3495573.1 hypothetical protein [Streptomyces turgidiscabies]GAQ70263.1 hypothetical protein T45_01997 [Streptomyces turgidiscabies]
MSKSEIRRMDREIHKATVKLAAVQRGESWPLNGAERRAMARATAAGAYKVVRGRSTARAEQQIDTTTSNAEMRLTAELAALHGEKQRLITEAAREKAAKKRSGWF